MTFLERIAPYRKAVAAFVVPGLVALGAALADGHVTAVEWVAVVLAAVGTSGTVYSVSNAPTPPPAQGGEVGPSWPDPGSGTTKHVL